MVSRRRTIGAALGLSITLSLVVGLNGLAAPPGSTAVLVADEVQATDVGSGRAMCPPGAAEIMPNRPATILVDLTEAGVWVLSLAATNENNSALEGSLEVVGYGTYPAPTVEPLEYYLGEATVDAPTVLEIVVVPIGRISVCVTIRAELVPVVTTALTTTLAPASTTSAPETTTTAGPPTASTSNVAPPSVPSSTVRGQTEVPPTQPPTPPPTLPVTGAPTALLAAAAVAALVLGAIATGLSRRR